MWQFRFVLDTGQLLSDAATIPNGFVIGMFMICDLSVTLFNNNNMVA